MLERGVSQVFVRMNDGHGNFSEASADSIVVFQLMSHQ
jgi:hypothetical protein